MCKLFLDWETEIKAYCDSNDLDYEKAKKMPKSWGKNDIAVQYIDKEKGKQGLLDDTPAPVVLWIRKDKNGSIIFEQTEHTEKYLKKIS